MTGLIVRCDKVSRFYKSVQQDVLRLVDMHVLWAAELQHTAASQALLVLLLLPLRERIGVCFRLSAPLSL